MTWTTHNISIYTNNLEPVQIDGIPEGFSFKRPDVIIHNKEHKGGYVAFVPLSEHIINRPTIEELLEDYKAYQAKHVNKRNKTRKRGSFEN